MGAHHKTLHEFAHQTLPGPNPEEPRMPPLPAQVSKGGEFQTPAYDLGLCRTQSPPMAGLRMNERGSVAALAPWGLL
jgi:hypothetical protein